MASIDDRIVAMEFDNKRFETNLATTMSSLEKLKTSLDFSKSTKNIGELKAAGDQFNMNHIGEALDGIASKFSILGVTAFTVLQNIVTRAFDAGVSIVKSLSLDQVIAGYREYETNLNAIQTVLANTKQDGTTLDDVNRALDILNAYSDKTIYNFSEMAKNIGTFTAAGVKLDTSVSAIKGIANLAAISGSNAEQASTAMYQLSQGLAAGRLTLMDWNSVVNAGMGGRVFQKALFDTGVLLGKIPNVPIGTTFDQWTGAGNTFRNSLQDGWLTAEVLTNTLEGFTGDLTDAQLLAKGYTQDQVKEIQALGQAGLDAATKVKTFTQLVSTVKEAVGSGWSATFRLLIGDFDEARSLFTGINDSIGAFVSKSAAARNGVLQAWKDFGGRTALIDGIKYAFQDLFAVLSPIKVAFREIFPAKTAQDLLMLTLRFRDFTQSLKPSSKTLLAIIDIFEGIFSAIKIVTIIVSEGAQAFGKLFTSFSGFGDGGILEFFAKIGRAVKELSEKLVAGGGIASFFDYLVLAIKKPGLIIDILKLKFKDFFDSFSSGFGPGQKIIDFFEKIARTIGDFLRQLSPEVYQTVSNFFGKIFDKFDPHLTNSLSGGFSRLGKNIHFLHLVVSKIGDVIQFFWDRLVGFGKFVVGTIPAISDVFSSLGSALVDAASNIDFDKVLELIKTGIAGVFSGSFAKIAKDGFKFDFLGGAGKDIGGFFNGLTKLLPNVKKSLTEVTDTLQAMQLKLRSEALLNIGIAIGIIAASMLVLSLINPADLKKALGALAIGFGELVATMGILNSVISDNKSAAKLAIVAGGLIAIATAMLILAAAMKIFATMSWEDIAKGLVAVGSSLLVIALTMDLMPKPETMLASSISLIAVATAMTILAAAVALFGKLTWEEIGKGLVGVGGGLLLIANAMDLMPNPASMLGSGVALIAIATAMTILAAAMKIFATLTWEEIGKGLIAVGGSLLLIAKAMKLMPKPASMLASGLSLLAISYALDSLADTMLKFARLSWDQLTHGLLGIASALLILALAADAMTETLPGAAATLVMAGALAVLVEVIKAYAGISWGDLLKGLIGLAATLAVLGVASLLLAEAIPLMIGLGVALALMGVGVALFGLGAQALAVAFGLMASAGTAGVKLIFFALDELVKRLPEIASILALGVLNFVKVILDALPGLIEAIGKIIGALLKVIKDNAPALVQTLVELIKTGIAAVNELAPDLIALGLTLLTNLLKGIRDNITQIVDLSVEIITKFLTTMTDKIPDITLVGALVLSALLKGIADNIGTVIDSGVDVLVSFLAGVARNIGDVTTEANKIMSAFIKAVGDYAANVIHAGTQVIVQIIEGIKNAADDIIKAGADAIISFVQGVASNAQKVIDSGAKIAIDFLNGIADSIRTHNSEFRDAGINIASAIAEGFRDGISSAIGGMADSMIRASQSVINSAKSVFSINSPSRVFIGIAQSVAEGFTTGIDSDRTMGRSITRFGDRTISSFQTALSKVSEILDNSDKFQPTITPVLDLAQVEKESIRINSLLGANPLSVAYNQAQALSIGHTQIDKTFGSDQPKWTGPTEIKFEQTINSPTQLSVADIYRQTNNQIALAKEELSVV